MADTVSRKVIEYVANTAKALTSIKTLEEANRRLVTVFGKHAPRAVKVLGTSLDSIKSRKVIDGKGVERTIPVFQKLGTNIQTADGKLQTFTHNQQVLRDGTIKTTGSLTNLDKSTVSVGQNIARLAKRAALTIPLWLALRTAFTGTFRVLSDGIKTIADQDRALQKARRNLQGTADNIDKNFKTLEQSARSLSLETGNSVEDIINAFQKFATVGFDFQTSLESANNATKLSILLFGDAEETANAFARTMRILVDESDDTRTAGQQIAEAMAQTAELWKTNAFELNEFTESLTKFAPTAKTMNLTSQQTIAILSALSTAGLRGGRAGRLLRTSFTKLITQTDKLAKSLGVKVNPEIDTTFDVFMRTLDAMSRTRNEAGRVAPAFEKVVKSIVGLRSSDAIKGLIALRSELNKNLAVSGDIEKFGQEFEDVNSQVFKLQEQMRNANREIGRAFVTGFVGGEDFKSSLQSIVQFLRRVQTRSEKTGRIFSGAFRLSLLGAFIEAFKSTEDSIDNTSTALSEHSKIVQDFVDKMGRATSTVEGFNEIEQSLSFDEQQSVFKTILDSLEQQLKARGALESQSLKFVSSISKQLGIEEDTLDVLKRQLDLERAIKEEKRLQSRFGSDTIKLFRIAQEQGVNVARQIGEVLSGQADFDLFVKRGGQAVDIFKKDFSDLFEQQQALAFFSGRTVPGARGLRGGTRIPIEEEAVRERIGRFSPEASLLASKATKQFERIQQAQITQTNTINNTFNVNATTTKEAIDLVEKALSSGSPQISKSLANLVTGNKQNNQL